MIGKVEDIADCLSYLWKVNVATEKPVGGAHLGVSVLKCRGRGACVKCKQSVTLMRSHSMLQIRRWQSATLSVGMNPARRGSKII